MVYGEDFNGLRGGFEGFTGRVLMVYGAYTQDCILVELSMQVYHFNHNQSLCTDASICLVMLLSDIFLIRGANNTLLTYVRLLSHLQLELILRQYKERVAFLQEEVITITGERNKAKGMLLVRGGRDGPCQRSTRILCYHTLNNASLFSFKLTPDIYARYGIGAPGTVIY